MEVASVTGHKTLKMLKRYTHMNALDLGARLGQKHDVNPTVRLLSTPTILCFRGLCES